MGLLDPPNPSSFNTPASSSLQSRRPSPSSSNPQAPPPTPDYVPPTRRTRNQCYAARNAFFRCLDAHFIVDAVKQKDEASAVCGAEDAEFSKECSMTWVLYFKEQRVVNAKKQEVVDRVDKSLVRNIS